MEGCFEKNRSIMYDKNILFFKSQLNYLEIDTTQSFDEIAPHSIQIREV